MRIHQAACSRYLSCPRSVAAYFETVSQVRQGAVTGAFVIAPVVRASLIGPLVLAQSWASTGRLESGPRASCNRRFHRLVDGRSSVVLVGHAFRLHPVQVWDRRYRFLGYVFNVCAASIRSAWRVKQSPRLSVRPGTIPSWIGCRIKAQQLRLLAVRCL